MRILLCSGLFWASFLSFSANVQTLDITAANKQFVLVLPANPTTGYQWTVKSYDKSYLLFKNSSYRAPVTSRVGAGGQMVFTFSRVNNLSFPKTTRVVFCYARSWEPASGVIKQVDLRFK